MAGYRDDLSAALARVTALERELAAVKAAKGAPNPDIAIPPFTDFHKVIEARMSAPVILTPRAQHKEWIPYALSAHGLAGTSQVVQRRIYKHFRPSEFFATDTASRPGFGTEIAVICSGAEPLLTDAVPTWVFGDWMRPEERHEYEAAVALLGTSAETEEIVLRARQWRRFQAANEMTWRTFSPGLDVSVQVRFKATCEWQAVFWGGVLR